MDGIALPTSSLDRGGPDRDDEPSGGLERRSLRELFRRMAKGLRRGLRRGVLVLGAFTALAVYAQGGAAQSVGDLTGATTTVTEPVSTATQQLTDPVDQTTSGPTQTVNQTTSDATQLLEETSASVTGAASQAASDTTNSATGTTGSLTGSGQDQTTSGTQPPAPEASNATPSPTRTATPTVKDRGRTERVGSAGQTAHVGQVFIAESRGGGSVASSGTPGDGPFAPGPGEIASPGGHGLVVSGSESGGGFLTTSLLIAILLLGLGSAYVSASETTGSWNPFRHRY